MRKRRKEMANHGHWERWMYLSLVMLFGWSAGCSAENSEGTGGYGGEAGQGGAALIEDRGVEESLVVHDPRWDPPEGLAQAIVPPSNATACTSGTQCPTGYCVDGFCCDSKCDNKCMACSAAKKGSGSDGICGSIKYDTDPDNDCPYGACDGKNMCKNYNGFSCTAAPQCLSNYCVDGFCCNNICMGSCQACSAAKKGSGQDGLCGSIKAATDPDNECSNSDCNGSGACTTSPQPTFPNGTACTASTQCASGYCADGVCCDSWCLGSCQACTAAKKNQGADGTCGNIANDKDPDEECWGGACNGAGVCKQYNGVPCVDKTQCLSNYCVDGFCCGNICTGWCYACSEARKGGGYDGACGPILSGRDPDSECTPGECNGSGTCNQAQTPLANGTACIASAQCASGNCIDGFCCDTACTETCKACSAAKKGSGANGTCGTIASETDPDSECGVGGRCGGNGTCKYYNGAACTSTAQCFSNYCADGVCCGNICNQTCNACSAAKKGQGVDGACGPIANTQDPDNECNPGECNGASACNQPQTPQANGAACALATQCSSGNCVDGVCCDTACTGSCQACSATKKGQGTSGTCGPIKYDTDPDNECPTGACSGTSLCQSYNGFSCTQTTQCLSNYCVDGVCCGNICTNACMACTAAKKGSGTDGVCGVIANNSDPDNECALTCNGAGACIKAPNGSTCTSAADCTSGFCADGYCCNSACSGLCQTCSAPGAMGTCSSGCPNQCTTTVGLPNAPLTVPHVVPLTGENVAIDTADFNADGKQDVVAVTRYGGVNIFMGQGNKTFGAPTTLVPRAYAAAVAAKDLNADGLADVVVASNPASSMSVFLNQGNGTFAARVDYAMNSAYSTYKVPDMLRIVDVSGDGVPDIAVSNLSAGDVSVFLGQGNGTFPNRFNVAASLEPGALAVADYNGDSKADLAVATQGTSSSDYRVSVSMGQGSFTFGTPVHYAVDRRVISLTTADVNADGRLDLVALGDDSSGTGKLYVLLGQTNGTFANAVSYAVSGSGRVIATNLNTDAFADIAVATRLSTKVAVFLGQANGTLGAVTEYTAANNASSLVALDVDNDNDKDVVTANLDSLSVLDNWGSGNLAIPLYSGTTIALGGKFLASADLNGDGLRDLVSVDSAGVTLTPLLGQANGTFVQGAGQSLSPNKLLDDLVLADMNGDAKPDLVYYYFEQRLIVIRFGQGNGTFGAASTYQASYPFHAKPVVGDIDGNGTLDVAMTGYYNAPATGHTVTHDLVTWWLNTGNGVLGTPSSQELYSAWDTDDGSDPLIAGGDFNGDGKFDLAPSCTRYGTVIMISQGNGQFTGLSNMITSFRNSVADLNGDGTLDLVGLARTNGQVTTKVWFNNGAGTFTAGGQYPDMGPWLEIGDMNSDSRPDLVSSIGSQIGVMLNQGNGAFGAAKMYAGREGSAELVLGDWNGNDRLDIAVQSTSVITLHDNSCLP